VVWHPINNSDSSGLSFLDPLLRQSVLSGGGINRIEMPPFDTDHQVLTVRSVVEVLSAPGAHAVAMGSADDVTFRG
jgi:hypothetical protein